MCNFFLVVSPSASFCLLRGAILFAQNESQIKAVAPGSFTTAMTTLLHGQKQEKTMKRLLSELSH